MWTASRLWSTCWTRPPATARFEDSPCSIPTQRKSPTRLITSLAVYLTAVAVAADSLIRMAVIPGIRAEADPTSRSQADRRAAALGDREVRAALAEEPAERERQ